MKELSIAGAIVFLAYLAFLTVVFGFTVYGLYLAFSASVILGIAAFVCEPSPLVFGATMVFFKVNLPAMIMAWLNAHGG